MSAYGEWKAGIITEDQYRMTYELEKYHGQMYKDNYDDYDDKSDDEIDNSEVNIIERV